MKEKFKKWFIGALAMLNTVEGFSHLVTSITSMIGIFKSSGTLSWMVFVSPIEGLIFGLFSIATGIILGQWTHNHHHNHH